MPKSSGVVRENRHYSLLRLTSAFIFYLRKKGILQSQKMISTEQRY